MKKISTALLLILAITLFVTACAREDVAVPGEQGQDIITAKEALESLGEEDVVFVDLQPSGDYSDGHLKGAVNIPRNKITTFGPFPNMLASDSAVEEVLSENGISNDSKVIIYDDNNNMDAGRLWWTMKVYGHENMQVISGGLKALKQADAELTTEEAEIETAEYNIDSKNEDIIATKEDVLDAVNEDKEDVVLLDVRSEEEYMSGTIPGSKHVNYEENIDFDGKFHSIDEVIDNHTDHDITPDKTVIMYCKTSIRAGNTFVALHNAGYRDLKVYDGAWIEWSSDSSLPVETPGSGGEEANMQDGS
ncbi:MAG: sulfurtransferase [Bacillota bacterium]